jgi:hypothetical protein
MCPNPRLMKRIEKREGVELENVGKYSKALGSSNDAPSKIVSAALGAPGDEAHARVCASYRASARIPSLPISVVDRVSNAVAGPTSADDAGFSGGVGVARRARTPSTPVARHTEGVAVRAASCAAKISNAARTTSGASGGGAPRAFGPPFAQNACENGSRGGKG